MAQNADPRFVFLDDDHPSFGGRWQSSDNNEPSDIVEIADRWRDRSDELVGQHLLALDAMCLDAHGPMLGSASPGDK